MQIVEVDFTTPGFESIPGNVATIMIDASVFDEPGSFTVSPASYRAALESAFDDAIDHQGKGMSAEFVSAAGIQALFIKQGYKVTTNDIDIEYHQDDDGKPNDHGVTTEKQS